MLVFAIINGEPDATNKIPKAWVTNMLDSFIDFIEGIYFIGYVQQMQIENPEQLDFEFQQFKIAYNL